MFLVDTRIWSLAWRRRSGDLATRERRLTQVLYELVREGRVQLLGSTRQEVLSGIREEPQYRRIRDDLRGFVDIALTVHDYEDAARLGKRFRRSGNAPHIVV